MAATEIEHAQDIIADFMETVVQGLRPPFRLAKFEGDANRPRLPHRLRRAGSSERARLSRGRPRARRTDNGAPGPRPHYGPGDYGAFLIDPEGWRIEAVTFSPT